MNQVAPEAKYIPEVLDDRGKNLICLFVYYHYDFP